MTKLTRCVAAVVFLAGMCLTTTMATPSGRADSLPNGYSVTCTANGGERVVCNVSGCPRVHQDEAGDVVHIMINGVQQSELSKGCNNTTTFNESSGPEGFTLGVQGCRKHPTGSDDCGAWSDYHYTPPASAAQAPAPANNSAPAAQQPVQCEGVGVEPPGTDCSKVQPIHCPAGSVSATVPAGQQCAAPTNAVAMDITRSGLNAHAAITNKSNLPASCTYTATKTGGVGPEKVDKRIDVGPNSTNAITDMLWPPLLTSYNAVVACTVTYNGKQTSIGQAVQNVTG